MQYQYTPANSSGKFLDIFDTSRTRHSGVQASRPSSIYPSDIGLSRISPSHQCQQIWSFKAPTRQLQPPHIDLANNTCL